MRATCHSLSHCETASQPASQPATGNAEFRGNHISHQQQALQQAATGTGASGFSNSRMWRSCSCHA
jgi:hypothetical protein